METQDPPELDDQGGAGVDGEAGGCRVGWSVVLGEFVGAYLVLVYGDPETGAERDVAVAVAQGGARSAACGPASSRSCSISSVNSTPSRSERVAAARCSLAATLTPQPHAVPITHSMPAASATAATFLD